MKECTGEAKEKEGEFDEMAKTSGLPQKEFIFIRLNVLREVKCSDRALLVRLCVAERLHKLGRS